MFGVSDSMNAFSGLRAPKRLLQSITILCWWVERWQCFSLLFCAFHARGREDKKNNKRQKQGVQCVCAAWSKHSMDAQSSVPPHAQSYYELEMLGSAGTRTHTCSHCKVLWDREQTEHRKAESWSITNFKLRWMVLSACARHQEKISEINLWRPSRNCSCWGLGWK